MSTAENKHDSVKCPSLCECTLNVYDVCASIYYLPNWIFDLPKAIFDDVIVT